MRALTRRLVPAFLALALLLQVASRTPPNPAGFFRIAIQDAAVGKTRLWLDRDGRGYFHQSGVTFLFGSSGRRLAFKSPFSGRISVSLSLWVERGGTAWLSVATGGPHAASRVQAGLLPGLNSKRFSCTAARDQTIVIDCNTDCVFSQPLVYREIAETKRRTIFLISADNLGADHMGCYGYAKNTTPRIDDFCREALLVKHAFANSPWTLPSHMSLFSSLPETEHGVTFHVADEVPTVLSGREPQLTIFPLERSRPFLTENLSRRFPAFSFNGGINVGAAYGFFRGFDLFREAPGDYMDRLASRRLFQKAREHLLDHPLPAAFYFLHTYHVHLPYRPSRRALAEIAPQNSLKRFDYDKDLGGITHVFRPLERSTVDEIRALYDAAVLDFDEEFGKFVEFLKARQLYDSSLIVLMSDHGEEFMEHGSWAHGTDLFNTQLRVPLIIKFPHQEFGGRVFAGNASLMDVLPTLLDYLGLPREQDCRGSSLMSEFKGGPAAGRSMPASLLRCKNWSLLPAKAALIHGSFKLIRNLPFAPGADAVFRYPPPLFPGDQLFDMARDPGETENVLRQHPLLFKRMAAELSRWLGTGPGRRGSKPARHKTAAGEAIEPLRTLGYLQ